MNHFCYKILKKSFEVKNEYDLRHLNSPYVYSTQRLEIERSLFNNDKTMEVWGLKNAKIAGKRIILIKPMIS